MTLVSCCIKNEEEYSLRCRTFVTGAEKIKKKKKGKKSQCTKIVLSVGHRKSYLKILRYENGSKM